MQYLKSYLLNDDFDLSSDDDTIQKEIDNAKESIFLQDELSLGDGILSSLYPLEYINENDVNLNDDSDFHQLAIIEQSIGCSPNENEISEIARKISEVKIGISEHVDTIKIQEGDTEDLYKELFGMQLIVPKGKIEKLRFKISFELPENSNESKKIYACDGFPKTKIELKSILSGKIKLGLSQGLRLIPIYGKTISEIIDINIDPWEISIGNVYKSKILYSGNLTSNPEWYFEGDGIEKDFEVSLIIKKSKTIDLFDIYIQAFWEYNPGLLKKMKFGTEKKKIIMHNIL